MNTSSFFWHRSLSLAAVLVLVACGDKGETTDADGDGSVASEDCDDSRTDVYPGADELCDGTDNNCDGIADEDPVDGVTLYVDSDGDGFGSTLEDIGCPGADGYASTSDDCDDSTDQSHPGATEICDSIDNNCDGAVDEGLTQTWYLDLDADGYGDPAVSREACTQPPSYVDNAEDCDDRYASVSPENRWYADADGDGYGSEADYVESCEAIADRLREGGDCDDSAATTRPGAASDADPSACTADADGDGFGDSSPPTGVTPGTDCDDGDELVYPGAVAEDLAACMRDSDGDGYGDSEPGGNIDPGTDCEDTLEAIHPDADEICDSRDNNCDGVVDDDAIDRKTFYYDADGDSYGDSSATTLACQVGGGYIPRGDDCDDTNDTVNPSAYEDCSDGVDNNCDGNTDDVCQYDAADAGASFVGSGRGDQLGLSMDAGGDIDDDGVADMVLGSLVAGSISSGKTLGTAYIFLGPVTSGSSLTPADADISVTGFGRDNFSTTASIGGDYNNDGHDDLAVGAPATSTTRGAAYIFFGPLTAGASLDASSADATLTTTATGASLGQYTLMPIDIDSDGADELVVSMPYITVGSFVNAGVIRAFSAPSGSLGDSDALLSISGVRRSAYTGLAVGSPGDVDGDGEDDLIYGAPGSASAFLLQGPITADADSSDAVASIVGRSSSDSTGSMATGGDLNGDGYADLVIGSPDSTRSQGIVQVIYGPVSGALRMGADEDATVAGTSAGQLLGVSQNEASIADIDGDGSADLLLGNADASTPAAYLFHGPISGSLTTDDSDLAVFGSGSHLGNATRLTDMDDDGKLDAVIAAEYGTSNAGAAYIFFNSTL